MYSSIFMDVATALADTGEHHGSRLFGGHWARKHWMNTPGTLYAADTDTCGTGPIEAPENVHMDDHSYEIIYRQPVNRQELDQVLSAADCDPMSGYGADGNLHWTRAAIKEWWSRREELKAEIIKYHKDALPYAAKNEWAKDYAFHYQQWLNYIQNGVEEYLRVYSFFLEEGRVPVKNETLPDL